MGYYVAVRPSVRRRFSSGPTKKRPEWNPHDLGGALLCRARCCVSRLTIGWRSSNLSFWLPNLC